MAQNFIKKFDTAAQNTLDYFNKTSSFKDDVYVKNFENALHI